MLSTQQVPAPLLPEIPVPVPVGDTTPHQVGEHQVTLVNAPQKRARESLDDSSDDENAARVPNRPRENIPVARPGAPNMTITQARAAVARAAPIVQASHARAVPVPVPTPLGGRISHHAAAKQVYCKRCRTSYSEAVFAAKHQHHANEGMEGCQHDFSPCCNVAVCVRCLATYDIRLDATLTPGPEVPHCTRQQHLFRNAKGNISTFYCRFCPTVRRVEGLEVVCEGVNEEATL